MPQKTLGARPPEALPPREPVAPLVARNRALVAILLPPAVALLVGFVTGAVFRRGDVATASAAPIFAALGLVSWLLGLRFYGLRGLGLRGGRPLFAGIGFAVLAWVAVLIGRFLPGLPQTTFNPDGQAVVNVVLLVPVMAIRSAGAGRAFAYLLLFEAFAMQIWAFGLLFRALADWRGGLTAAIAGGILFGTVAFALFDESFVTGLPGLGYFLLWGVLYGLIRLRTGSLLGPTLVQALQSFTAWFVFQPPADIAATGIQTVFLATSLLFVIIIWRLWPRREGDYRI